MTPPRIVGYDTLVIAIGSVTNGFGTPGVAEHAALLETMAQAERLNQRLDCRPSSIAGALRIDNPLDRFAVLMSELLEEVMILQ